MGGLASSDPDRLTAAGNRGTPQVVVPGSADLINFLGPKTVPQKYKKRKIYSQNPQATLIRTNVRDNRLLGKAIADKLNRSRGPVVVLWPKKGLSTLDKRGKPFRDPEADMEEYIEGVRALAVPLNINRGNSPAAIWAVGLRIQIKDEVIPQYSEYLKKIATEIEIRFSTE